MKIKAITAAGLIVAAISVFSSAAFALLHDASAGLRLESNLSKSVLVLRHVLLQHVEERLGLLRTDVNPLKVLNGYVVGRSLIHDAEQ